MGATIGICCHCGVRTVEFKYIKNKKDKKKLIEQINNPPDQDKYPPMVHFKIKELKPLHMLLGEYYDDDSIKDQVILDICDDCGNKLIEKIMAFRKRCK